METAVQELITYFEQQKQQGCKNWCIEDLLAQLYQAKEMDREQRGYSEIDLEVAFFQGRVNKLTFIQWLEKFKNQNK